MEEKEEKGFLPALLERKEAKAAELMAAVEASGEIAEVRALGENLKEVTRDAEDIRAQLAAAPAAPAVETRALSLSGVYGPGGGPGRAATLGEHFIEEVRDALPAALNGRNWSLTASEYATRAATDTHTAGPWAAPLLSDVDREFVREYRRPLVDDLFGSGVITGTMLTYFVEGDQEGAPGTWAEGETKEQVHFTDPEPVTEALKTIAGWVSISKPMFEDLPYVVSEINTRLLYALALKREQQLMDGDGTGNNLKGLLRRDGLLEEYAGWAGDWADALYRAVARVQEETGYSADGVIINPADYQRLRLSKDANGQYFGGGLFGGAYGTSGLAWEPPIWGLRTVVSAAVPAGTAVVGAFAQCATVYSKGGVSVTSTDSHAENFVKNVVVVLAEERLAFAVRVPKAFCKVELNPMEAPHAGAGADG